MKQIDATNESSSQDHHVTNQQQQQRQKQLSSANESANQMSRHTSTYNRLVEACKRKDLAKIRSIIEERPELVNKRDKHNRNLLHYTVILVDDDEPDATTRQRCTSNTNNNSIDTSVECFNYVTDRCDLKLWWQQDSDGLSVLHLAVISSNVPLVKHIIYEHPYSTKYPLVCTVDNEHHSPLHWAVITNNLECVRLLIGYAGVKLAHEPDLNGATPLHYATQASDYPKYRQQLRNMLKCVGDSTTKSPTQNDDHTEHDIGKTKSNQRNSVGDSKKLTKFNSFANTIDDPQQQKCGLEILEYLVRLPQVNLECMDKDRRTPLLWAASSGSREATVLLVSHGANVLSYDINRLGALHCAASHGFTECLECLLNLSGANCATSASNQSQVNQADNLNCTPLFYSVLSGNIDCVEILLDRGAKCDWQDAKGRTAAHFAALRGQLNSLKLLHDRGANLWLANKQGDLPLHYAIKSGRQQVVQWLLEHSPYERAVNAINNFGRAPIHLAIMKDNLQMCEYLISCGANLNQLVKVKAKQSNSSKQVTGSNADDVSAQTHQTKSGAVYHYETAMDMATKLRHHDCLKLLIANNALPASKVMSNRLTGRPGGLKNPPKGNTMSLFDLQSVDGPSPIGFETSSSSASMSLATDMTTMSPRAQQSTQSDGNQQSTRMPKMPARPAPDRLPTTDSTGSSALSQNSLTSVRGTRPTELPPPTSQQHQNQQHQNQQQSQQQQQQQQQQSQYIERDSRGGMTNQMESPEVLEQKPYKGGISYNNELIDASIKCKVYNREYPKRPMSNQSSFPPDNRRTQKGRNPAARTSQSASSDTYHGPGQEIITNVNVYTSPCGHCAHNQIDHCTKCADYRRKDYREEHSGHPYNMQQSRTVDPSRARCAPVESDSDATSEATTGDSEQEVLHMQTMGSRQQLLPSLTNDTNTIGALTIGQPRGQLRGHLPPSHGYEQHLPAIMSEQEHSTSATSNEQSPRSPYDAIDASNTQQDEHQEHQLNGSQNQRLTSAATQEPRFDRSQHSRTLHRVDRYRDQVRSPVADYIHSPLLTNYQDQQQRATSLVHQRHVQQPKMDYSQVRSKIDSHWTSNEYEADAIRSKSMSNMQAASDSGIHSSEHQSGRSPVHMQEVPGSRSVSRQTIIRTRRLSVDSVELATTVEKSIRKYRQETKLFEELQNLKRNQIRSGRANEALLVKRLVEHFSHEVAPLELLEPYHGPYTYKSYERFLYDQLRKLSQSNCAKLSKIGHDEEHHGHHMEEPNAKYLGDRNYLEEDFKAEMELRKVMGSDGDTDSTASYIIERSGALEDIRVKGKSEFDDTTNTYKLINEGGEFEPASEVASHEPEKLNIESGRMPDTDAGHDIQRRPSGDTTSIDREKSDATIKGNEPREDLDDVTTQRTSSSSMCSSRRSSIETEREKLQNLPLRVSSDEQNFDQQVDTMAQSIMVDALGNVSRAGSAKARPSLERGHTTTEPFPANESSDDRLAQENNESLQETEQEEQQIAEKSKLPAAVGRRRSIVNIGNKVEEIYHAVSIEIDKASDREHSEDNSDSESQKTTSETQASAKLKGKSVDRLEDVEEHEDEKVDDEEDGRAPRQTDSELPIEEDSTKQETGRDDGIRADDVGDGGVDATVATAGSVDSDSKSVSDLGSMSSSALRETPVQSSDWRRRASSPSAYGPSAKRSEVAASGVRRPDRRSISIDRPTQNQAPFSEGKKVYNGYDLDEMRGRSPRKSSTGMGEAAKIAGEERRGSNNNVGLKSGNDATATISENNATITSSPVSDRAIDEGFVSRSTIHKSINRISPIATSPTKRKRLERSHLPRGRYIVQVPLEEIRARWSRIKARERKRKRWLEANKAADLVACNKVDINSLAGDSSIRLSTQRSQSMAKSQPSLESKNTLKENELQLQTSTTANTATQFSNFVLLYEINKNVAGDRLTHSRTSESANCKRINWCHRRVVRIVDVRTLKRTLSLPESIIYSNNLLTRFNILRL